MALLTTTPAREMTPMPDMIIPKGDFITVNPRNAPPKDKTTEDKMMAGWMTELNRVTRIKKIRKRATTNACLKNSSDSF